MDIDKIEEALEILQEELVNTPVCEDGLDLLAAAEFTLTLLRNIKE